MNKRDVALLTSMMVVSFLLVSCREGIPDTIEGSKSPGKGMSACVYQFEVGTGNKWSGTVRPPKSEGVVWVNGLEAGKDGVSMGVNPDLQPLLGICPDIEILQFVKKNKDGSLTPLTFEGGCSNVSESYASDAKLRCYKEKR